MYNTSHYWTGSPFKSISSSYAYVASVSDANSAGRGGSVYNADGVRPVITLKANTIYTGTGTLTDPFIVN